MVKEGAKSINKTYGFYKKHKEDHVTFSEYNEIASMYCRFLVEKVFQGETITLPGGVGSLSIQGKKYKPRFSEEGKILGLAPNWPKTKALWARDPDAKAEKKLVYHMNEHTDMIRYKFLWSKERCLITNKSLYSLRMSRFNKREVHRRIKEGQEFKTI